MVAEGGSIIANSVEELNGGGTLGEIYQIIVLNSVSGIEQNDIEAHLLVLLLQTGNGGQTVDTAGSIPEMIAVCIVSVENDELG